MNGYGTQERVEMVLRARVPGDTRPWPLLVDCNMLVSYKVM